MAKRTRTTTKVEPKFSLWWIADRDRFRVWRMDWPGDVFEVLYKAEFETLKAVCQRFNIPLEEHFD